tara:strand:+ start:3491 stop:4165 length:675 start_codon:yes stop_codon:yes gene_type:complete
MNKEDRSMLGSALNAAMRVGKFGKPLDADSLDLWLGLLMKYEFVDVTEALTKYFAQCTDAPAPADIIEILNGTLGYPSPEEAWNLLPKDERSGGYVNQQMMDAWAICDDSMSRNDMIGARMAFIECYRKSCNKAKLEGVKAVYFYSSPTGLAFEQKNELKHQKTLEAVNKGWLDSNSAFVKQTLAITNEPKVIALEHLGKMVDSKVVAETKSAAMSNIRSILRG